MKIKRNCCWFSIVKMATTQCLCKLHDNWLFIIHYAIGAKQSIWHFDEIMKDDRLFILRNMSNHIMLDEYCFEIRTIDIVHIACSRAHVCQHSFHHSITLLIWCHLTLATRMCTAFSAYIFSHWNIAACVRGISCNYRTISMCQS